MLRLRALISPAAATRPGLAWPRLAGAIALTLAIALLAAMWGAVAIPWEAVVKILLSRLPGVEIGGPWPHGWETIVWEIRLPRVVMAGLVGATLAMAGATYQALFHNPLADPYFLGVAAGAGLGATIAIVSPLSISAYYLSPLSLLAFLGALGAVGAAYGLARTGRTVPMTTLILAGVAIGSLCAAATSLLLILNGQQALAILAWLLGGFGTAHWGSLNLLWPYLLLAAVVLLAHRRILNVMQLDEEQARSLGIDVERTKLLLVGAATLATAAAVSVGGLIGFVGLIVPHAVRLLWGPDYRQLLPLSMLLGGAFLILADLLARTVAAPGEIPVGVVTAFFGAPFFLYILRQRKRAIF